MCSTQQNGWVFNGVLRRASGWVMATADPNGAYGGDRGGSSSEHGGFHSHIWLMMVSIWWIYGDIWWIYGEYMVNMWWYMVNIGWVYGEYMVIYGVSKFWRKLQIQVGRVGRIVGTVGIVWVKVANPSCFPVGKQGWSGGFHSHGNTPIAGFCFFLMGKPNIKMDDDWVGL